MVTEIVPGNSIFVGLYGSVSRAGATHCPPHLGHGYWDDWDLNGPNHRRYEQRKGFLKTFQHNRIPRVWVCLVEFSNKNIPDSQSICKVDENPSIKSPLTRSHIANPMIRILEGYKLEKQQFSGHTSSALFPEISWLLHEVQTPRRSKIHKYCAEWLMASCWTGLD